MPVLRSRRKLALARIAGTSRRGLIPRGARSRVKEMVLEGGLLGGQRRELVVGRRVDLEEVLCECCCEPRRWGELHRRVGERHDELDEGVPHDRGH